MSNERQFEQCEREIADYKGRINFYDGYLEALKDTHNYLERRKKDLYEEKYEAERRLREAREKQLLLEIKTTRGTVCCNEVEDGEE